ncbi:hypothetical protein TNCV_1869031 [Trichonephila clavipes]|nr:hypothetical protein TNCV_1869031 [Trichonephila clavipes]
MTHTSLVQIAVNLNAYWSISDILRPVVVSNRRGLPNFLYQQDNVRPKVARRVLTFLDILSIRMLPSPAGSTDLLPKNIWPRVTERLIGHPSLVNMVDEVWHRLE